MKKLSLAIPALLAASLLGACVPTTNSTVYSPVETMQAAQVDYGTIVDARSVDLRHVKQGAGTAGAIAGGLAGALAGNQLGGGNGKTIMTGLGAIGGAYAGGNLAQRANSHQGMQWFVDLDDGRSIAVIQNDPSLAVGARVRVLRSGGETRLVRR